MSAIVNCVKNLLTKFCQQGVADRANFLKNIAVIGWILSSAAQTCAVIFNKDIPQKEKKFLVPQEILDGIINCTLFWFITSKATDFGKKLVLTKKILPKKIALLLSGFKSKAKNVEALKSSFLKYLGKVGGSGDVKIATDAIEGMGVLSGIAGAIVSNNICTPIIRNNLAAYYQKRELGKQKKISQLNPNFGNIDFSKYDFEKLTPAQKINTFKGFYRNPNLKI